jgi:apolipoprotein N-acyltransferase
MERPGREVGSWDRAAPVLAVGAGLALGWAFADFRFWVLPWIAVAPFIAIAETSRPGRAARLGWLGGVAGIAAAFSWLVYAFQVFGGFSRPVALALFVPPVAWMGFEMAVFTGLVSWLGPLPLGLAAPLTFTLVELAFPTLFPWRLAHTQMHRVSLLQTADLAGPYLLGFAIVWVNAGIVRLLRAGERAPLAAALGLLALLGVYGVRRAATVETLRTSAPMLRVGVVQGNIGVERKGERSFFRRNLDDYRRLSLQLADEVDLLVWPETVAQQALDVRDRRPAPDVHPFATTPRPLVFGGLAIGEGPEGRRLYNSAFLTDATGTIIGRYDKRILVPFGEYLPFASRFPWLRRMSPASGRFSAGTEATLLHVTGTARIGPLICYEDVVPGPAREAARHGATLLLNLTNDAWYGRSAEPYQHQALALWRAVETRRDFVRSTNTGLTAAISATGNVLMEMPIFVAAARRVDVRLLDVPTFYAAWGDVFALVTAGAWGVAAFLSRRVVLPENLNRDAALKTPSL